MKVLIFWLGCALVVVGAAAIITGIMAGVHPLELLLLTALIMGGAAAAISSSGI